MGGWGAGLPAGAKECVGNEVSVDPSAGTLSVRGRKMTWHQLLEEHCYRFFFKCVQLTLIGYTGGTSKEEVEYMGGRGTAQYSQMLAWRPLEGTGLKSQSQVNRQHGGRYLCLQPWRDQVRR